MIPSVWVAENNSFSIETLVIFLKESTNSVLSVTQIIFPITGKPSNPHLALRVGPPPFNHRRSIRKGLPSLQTSKRWSNFPRLKYSSEAGRPRHKISQPIKWLSQVSSILVWICALAPENIIFSACILSAHVKSM